VGIETVGGRSNIQHHKLPYCWKHSLASVVGRPLVGQTARRQETSLFSNVSVRDMMLAHRYPWLSGRGVKQDSPPARIVFFWRHSPPGGPWPPHSRGF